METKQSFFSLRLELETFNNKYKQEELDNIVDLIISSLGVKTNCYKFENKEEKVYLFKTETRKRKGQLVKLCDKLLPTNQYYVAEGLTRITFISEIERLKKNPNFELLEKPMPFIEYNANDIEIFNNIENWHSWQKDIYEKIFHTDTNTFKKPDPRRIISLVDKKGNSGKSSFFKWLFYKKPSEIGRIGYGSASQLRSSVVNMGKKDLYIVDLARSKSKDDRQEDLLSVLEDIKSGLVTNAMYGSGKTLLMEPPHIIVSSNYVLKYELLSSDRWEVYEINSSNKLQKLKHKQELKK